MRELEIERQQERIHALRNLGVDGNIERLFASQIAAGLSEDELSRLPEDAAAYVPLQDSSGAAGFVVDMSSIDGPDPIQ